MTQHLLLVSIGPIQEFIASARRSRDLWFGSHLLSELSKAAARSIAEQQGTLIFPAPAKPNEDLQPDSDLNVANKVLALVDCDNVATVAGKVEMAICNRLREMRDNAFGNIKSNYYQDIAYQQVDDLVECYWVAVPFASDTDDYAKKRQTLEALMAARKTTRTFDPVTWGRCIPKSSLDGQRESVIPEDQYPKRGDSDKPEKLTALRINYGAKGSEQLSGVDLLKRLGKRGKETHFMSTSHVAALPFLKRLELIAAQATDSAYLKIAWERYQSSLEQLGCEDRKIGSRFPNHSIVGHADGAIFFEERLQDILIKPPKDHLQSARDELQAFLGATVGKGIRPSPYYALLLADGDRMGKIIDHQKSLKQHQELSQKLDGFAGGVRDIVEKQHSGALIYAGGDDVLALVPLHTVLACADALADDFAKKMDGFQDAENNTPTLSVGIAVAHFLEPMSDALTLARAAEKAAKVSRNALAIMVSKRSGSDRTIAGVWGTVDEQLEQFIKLHCDDRIPDGAAYEIATLADTYGNDLPIDALQHETNRILGRKRTSHEQKLDKDVLEELNVDKTKDAADIERLAHTLIIARMFADAQQLASVKTESG